MHYNNVAICNRVRPRFFDQIGHETMYSSSGNKGFPNEPDVGYRNFFIPRVEKTSKNEPAGGELFLPKGLF